MVLWGRSRPRSHHTQEELVQYVILQLAVPEENGRPDVGAFVDSLSDAAGVTDVQGSLTNTAVLPTE